MFFISKNLTDSKIHLDIEGVTVNFMQVWKTGKKISMENVSKETIIEACHELFAQNNYEQISMNEIASKLNISTEHLHLNFSSKKILYAHLIENLNSRALVNSLKSIPEDDDFNKRLAFLFNLIDQKESYFNQLLSLLCKSGDEFEGLAELPTAEMSLQLLQQKLELTTSH